MSVTSAFDVASIAVTRTLGPNTSELEDTLRLMSDFYQLSEGDKIRVVAMLSGWVGGFLAMEPDPEAHLQEMILDSRRRLEIDA